MKASKLTATPVTEPAQETKATKKSTTGARVGMVAFFLLLALFVSFFLGILPIAPVAVATGSMEPTIGVGDVVVVVRTDPDRLQTGDIVRYRKDNYSVIHRIVAREEGESGQADAFITQGDNNNGPDADPVSPEQIMGKVILIVPNAGKFTVWLHSLL